MTQLILFEDMNTYDTTTKTTQEQLGYDSYQVFDPQRTFTLYRDNKALTKSQNAKWQNTDQSETDPNGLPKASVGIRLTCGNLPRGSGTFKTTWFVTVRGQKYTP